jgi:hypothetical protein
VNVTDVLSRVMQLQVQAAAAGVATKSSGSADFAALLASARTAATPGQPAGLQSALTSLGTAGTPLPTTLLPANLRAAAPVDAAEPTPVGDAAPPMRKCCGSH